MVPVQSTARLAIALAAATAVVSASLAQATDPTVNGYTLKTFGQSGKFELTPEAGGDSIRIEIDSIKELDADGNEVGTGGTPDGKHSVNAVASLDWTISPVETVWWGEEGAAGSVSGDRVRFTVPLAEDGDGAFAEVILDATLFKKNGTLRSVWDVKAGDSKFELTINNWPFCAGESGNPCQGAVGTQLQVTIAVSGPAAADKADSARSGLDVYKFGSTNAVIALNSDIWVNSVLAQGNVTFSGGSIVVTFDKPEDGGDLTDFNWDPVMSLDGENMVADASGSATTTAGAAALSVACLLAAIATARTE